MKFGKIVSADGYSIEVDRRLNSAKWEITMGFPNSPYERFDLSHENVKDLILALDSSCNTVTSKSKESVEPVKYNIAEEAINIVHGDREQTYGSPTKNLDTIAQFWNGYINSKNKSDTSNLTGQDVANLMMLLKIARLANSPDHRDSLVDTVGYALLSEICNGDKN